MKSKFAILIAVTVSLSPLAAASASGSAVYTYTGNPFTIVESPYTTSDSVTASIVFSAALGDNLDLMNVAPMSFSISDGINTVTQASSPPVHVFSFSTNASGVITNWNIDVENGTPVTAQIITQALCTSSQYCDLGENIASTTSEGYNVGPAGKWAGPNQPIASTPLPAALPLFATGLAVTGLLGWRKKRKNAAALAAA